MAKSTSNEEPRTFLIKVNPDATPGRVGVPHQPSQWEEGTFRTDHPRKTKNRVRLAPEQVADPRAGDRLYIWINEEYGGRGLTARANVRDVSPANSQLLIAATSVDLLLSSSIGRHRAGQLVTRGNIFEDVLRSTSRTTLRSISGEDARDIDKVVRQRPTGNRPQSDPLALSSAPPSAPAPDELAAERQRVMRLIEQRANQGPFRDAVMARDGQRCLVTGCRTTEVLEAAHLIPYASGHRDRDNPSNGILLRADIHLLFDRNLMAVNPETMELWVSSRLRNTAYVRLGGKTIRTSAGRPFLAWQYVAATQESLAGR